MILSEYLKMLGSPEVRGPENISIESVSCHSGKIGPNSLFVAIPGFTTDGRQYVLQAVAAGAKAVVFEGPFFDNLDATQIRVSGARLALAQLAAGHFVHPTKSLTLVGVTGTNGKTTLTYLMESLWKAVGFKTGVLGTINIRYGDILCPASQTTPESRDLQELFAEMVKHGVEKAIMEVSSHGVALSRVEECHFDACAFTNLTQDHLDFHGTMEEYYLAKEALFIRHLARSEKKSKLAVICIEDVYGERLANQCRLLGLPVATYGLKNGADMRPLRYQASLTGVDAELQVDDQKIKIQSPLMGRFNLLNMMAAVRLALHTGLTVEQVEEGIRSCRAVPGRMERIDDPKGRLIYVDYAHTPDALANVLRALHDLNAQRIITVMGCGGDRDPTKRPKMGFEAAKASQVCIVTSDNPRTEDPDKIIGDILPGIQQAGQKKYLGNKGFIVETDRKNAIQRALEIAGPGDVVLIAGKGHEDYQIIGSKKYPFSDQQVVRDFINS